MYSRTMELGNNLNWLSEYIKVDYLSQLQFYIYCRAVILLPYLNMLN